MEGEGVEIAMASPWAPPLAMAATTGSLWWWMPRFILLRRLLFLNHGTCHGLSVLGVFGASFAIIFDPHGLKMIFYSHVLSF